MKIRVVLYYEHSSTLKALLTRREFADIVGNPDQHASTFQMVTPFDVYLMCKNKNEIHVLL